MRRVGVSPVRSEAQHRSDSVARSTPTLPHTSASEVWARARPKKSMKIKPFTLRKL
ncbi:MAG: hypothetical protein NZ519_09215 [Bacteroidia bacterium]|nr:hypothetical protein [Bacteroidia bacterium]